MDLDFTFRRSNRILERKTIHIKEDTPINEADNTEINLTPDNENPLESEFGVKTQLEMPTITE